MLADRARNANARSVRKRNLTSMWRAHLVRTSNKCICAAAASSACLSACVSQAASLERLIVCLRARCLAVRKLRARHVKLARATIAWRRRRHRSRRRLLFSAALQSDAVPLTISTLAKPNRRNALPANSVAAANRLIRRRPANQKSNWARALAPCRRRAAQDDARQPTSSAFAT